MILKSDGKSEGKLTCSLKNDIRNMVSFHASSQKSENLHFDALVLFKAYKVLDEKVQKSCVMTLKCDEKFEEKLPLGSRNNMRNLLNFNGSGEKSEDFHFDVLFLSKVFYVLVKKNVS